MQTVPSPRLTYTVNKSPFFYLLGLAGTLAMLLVSVPWLQERSLNLVANVSSCVVVMVIVALLSTSRNGLGDASSTYGVVFALFHFGLTSMFGLGVLRDATWLSYLNQWFYRDTTQTALILTTIAYVTYALGVLFTRVRSQPFKQVLTEELHKGNISGEYGSLILCLGVLGWFLMVVQRGGTGLLTSSYGTFLLATAGVPLPVMYYLIGLGIVFVAATSSSKWKRFGYGVFGAWALVAFPLGLRGEVLFPAFTAVMMEARQHRLVIHWKKAAGVGFCLLMFISLGRSIRSVGAANVALSDVVASPVDAIAEMGASLRPVSEVVLWHQSGDDFQYGSTYWAPIDRALYYLIPGWTRPEALEDERLMNIVVADRVGPIGFSPVAEAYVNFGLAGVVLIPLLVGWGLGLLESIRGSWTYQASLGVVFLPLLIQVRNDFTAIPAQIAAGLASVLVAAVISRSVWRGTGERYRLR